MEKPITLKIEELKQDVINTINESGLPVFLLDYVLKGLYDELHILNQSQLTQDRESYEKALEEESVK